MDEVVARPDERRMDVLNHAIATYIEHGYTLEHAHGYQAVMVKRRSAFTFFDAAMTVLAAGLWLIVILIRTLDPLVDRAVLSVDAKGKLHGRFS